MYIYILYEKLLMPAQVGEAAEISVSQSEILDRWVGLALTYIYIFSK